VSRGTCAIVGVLADHTSRFDRVVLVIPPAGTAAGRYREWLGELPLSAATAVTTADILILAMRGDTGHHVNVCGGLGEPARGTARGVPVRVPPAQRAGGHARALPGLPGPTTPLSRFREVIQQTQLSPPQRRYREFAFHRRS